MLHIPWYRVIVGMSNDTETIAHTHTHELSLPHSLTLSPYLSPPPPPPSLSLALDLSLSLFVQTVFFWTLLVRRIAHAFHANPQLRPPSRPPPIGHDTGTGLSGAEAAVSPVTFSEEEEEKVRGSIYLPVFSCHTAMCINASLPQPVNCKSSVSFSPHSSFFFISGGPEMSMLQRRSGKYLLSLTQKAAAV